MPARRELLRQLCLEPAAVLIGPGRHAVDEHLARDSVLRHAVPYPNRDAVEPGQLVRRLDFDPHPVLLLIRGAAPLGAARPPVLRSPAPLSLRLLCHNICCLISAAYELGIVATFWGQDEPETVETTEVETADEMVEALAWM